MIELVVLGFALGVRYAAIPLVCSERIDFGVREVAECKGIGEECEGCVCVERGDGLTRRVVEEVGR